ncbi:peptidase M75 family protein [Rhodococcus sp. D2-41]|nr:peptidase M75 family protein [Rhodococcus sp. D2-41]
MLAVTLGAAALAALTAACGSGTSPSADAAAPAKGTVNVTITDAGCKADPSTLTAGAVTFNATNTDAAAVTEVELLSNGRIIAEKENLAPGFSGKFSLKLDGGEYDLYCPGATQEHTKITVTGKTAAATGDTATLLQQGAADYATYVKTQAGLLVDNVKPMVDAIKAGDLAAAQAGYAKSRVYYERIEPVAESFTIGSDSLDQDIDAREGDVPADQWTGFHVIEKGLFEAKSVSGLAPVADGLLANVGKLRDLVQNQTYKPDEIVNGAGGLLDEVSTTKITGEEERYSHIDIVDLQANVEGSEQAFAAVKPALEKIDPALAQTIGTRFTAVDQMLDKYRDPNALGGFALFSSVSPQDLRALSEAIAAVKDPLSEAGGKIAAAG